MEKSKPLSKNKPEDTSTDTALENAGIAFSFYFFPLIPLIISWKRWNLYFSMTMHIFKTKMHGYSSQSTYQYWERAMSKVGHAKINIIIFQSLEVKQSFRRVRNQTFNHE